MVEGAASVGRPKKSWQDYVSANLKLRTVLVGSCCRMATGRKVNPATLGNTADKRR